MSMTSKALLWGAAAIAALVLHPAAAAADSSKAHKEAFSDPVAYLALPVMGEPLVRFVANEEGAPSAIAPAAEALDDSKILFVAHVANAGEIEQAKLAEQRSHDARVRRLAKMILRQHARADRKEEDLIKKRKLDMVSTPVGTELQSDAQEVLNQLNLKTGVDFDRAFLDAQIAGHRRVLGLIDNTLLPEASSGDVKTLIRDLRPAVQGHLDEARSLQMKIKE